MKVKTEILVTIINIPFVARITALYLKHVSVLKVVPLVTIFRSWSADLYEEGQRE
jgi:hypothetical protein